MLILGSGGTGKSQIQQALTRFAWCWQHESHVVVTATTGVAAILVGGQTLHSALALGCNLEKYKALPHDSPQSRAWASITLLMADEIGMANSALFGGVDARTRNLKCNELPFGGVHLIMTGDLLQLPSPSGSIYRANLEAKGKTGDFSRKGAELWRTAINAVIVLTQNHRQSSDPDYAALLDRFRVGEHKRADYEYLNSRVISPTCLPPPGTPFAVAENADRDLINRSLSNSMCAICRSSASWMMSVPRWL